MAQRSGKPLAVLAAACLLALPGAARSGEAGAGESRRDALSESHFLSELPVVLSATRLPQPLSETPAAMTVIDRETIRDSGAWDVADLFRLVPGMFVAYNVDNEVVPGHVVSYHGLADPFAKRMQILVDGRSVYTPLFGGPIWSNIPLHIDDIERVEVVRGPSAATYGANSFLGAINIVTRDPAEVQGRMLSLAAGDPGRDAAFRYGGRVGALDYRMTLQLREDEGYTVDPEPKFNDADAHPRFDNKRIGNLAVRGDFRPGGRDELQFQFGYSGGTRQTGALANNNPPRDKEVASQFALLRWQRDLGPDSQFGLRFYHNRERLDEDSSGSIRPTVFGPYILSVPSPLDRALQHVAERFDLEAQHSLPLADSLRAVWGGGVRADRVRSLLYLGSGDFVSFRQRNLFGNLEWRPKSLKSALSFNVGAMLESNSFVGTRTSPRLAANFHLTPAQTIRAAVGRAYRNPVLYERLGDSRWTYTSLSPVAGVRLPLQYLYGERNLKPERIDSREIGYLFEFGRAGSLDLKYSYDTLNDLVEMFQVACPGGDAALCARTTPGTGVRTFGNRGGASLHSFEAQWQQRLSDDTRIHFGASSIRIAAAPSPLPASASYVYGRSAPRHAFNLLLSHQFTPGWRASVGGYRVGALKAISGDALPGYTRWDLRVARQFRWTNGKGELALVAQNPTGSAYREFYADNVWGRRVFAGLRLEF